MARLRSIRFRLLAAVNTAMALLFLVLLVVDYYRETAARVAETHIALEGEAKTLLPAVVRLRAQGIPAIQDYVDTVCGQMHESSSPGHHIAVRLGDVVVQAMAHQRASADIFAAMQAAARSPTYQAKCDAGGLVVGSSEDADVCVYISEYLTNIHRSARGHMLLRLAWLLLLAIVATLAINLVFLRMAAKPLEKLVGTVRQIARGRFGVQAGPFKTEELDYLATEINSMSSSLAAVERRRQHEMDKARRIQEHLLPREIGLPGLTVAHLYQPAAEVAGDYYDVVAAPDGSWLLCVADVCGHGVPAAMSAAMLKTLLMHAADRDAAPAKILRFINMRFARVSLDGDFATMILARWVPEAAKLEYASAGHGNSWFLRGGGGAPRELPSTGLPLGVEGDATWKTGSIRVASGDRLLLATDGIPETFNRAGKLFGSSRLAELFQQYRGAAPSELVKKIDKALTAHRTGRALADDCTVVAVEFAALKTRDQGFGIPGKLARGT